VGSAELVVDGTDGALVRKAVILREAEIKGSVGNDTVCAKRTVR
jgi:hypothetical protein